MTFNDWATTAIGSAKANATSAPCPFIIANAVPSPDPTKTSGGTAPPIWIAPIKTNSNVAPINNPVFKSPNASPTIGETTIGLITIGVPPTFSINHNTAKINPTIIAVYINSNPPSLI